MRGLWITMLLAVACEREQPLERLDPPPAVALAPSPAYPPPPPPPPPPPAAAPIPMPAPIAALVRDRFGLPTVTLTFEGRTRTLTAAEASTLIARLSAPGAFQDGTYGCACGDIAVRIARGDEHVDFTVNCGNVSIGGQDVASLDAPLIEMIDAMF